MWSLVQNRKSRTWTLMVPRSDDGKFSPDWMCGDVVLKLVPPYVHYEFSDDERNLRSLFKTSRQFLDLPSYQRLKQTKRMSCCVIPPLRHLNWMHQGTRYFCLAHWYLQCKEYRQFFLAIRRGANVSQPFIILDNGAAERELVTSKELLSVVQELQPDEVISPDVLFDGKKTLKNLYRFVEELQICAVPPKVLGCPQGKTIDEWLACYMEMLRLDAVHTIGLSKISVPKVFGGHTKDQGIAASRQVCVALLDKYDLIQKELHLLGQGDPREFKAYRHILIRSTDSCYPMYAALCGIDLARRFKRVPTTNAYFAAQLAPNHARLAVRNIFFLKKCLK